MELFIILASIYLGIVVVHTILIAATKAYKYSNVLFAFVTIALSPISIFATTTMLIHTWYNNVSEEEEYIENFRDMMDILGYRFVNRRELKKVALYMSGHAEAFQLYCHMHRNEFKEADGDDDKQLQKDMLTSWFEFLISRHIVEEHAGYYYLNEK